jgi:hypothetical protein
MVYLDIAEEQTLNQKPMYMKDWLKTIDDYLCMTRRDILEPTDRVMHIRSIPKAPN